jgi:hypothetical protein
VYADMLARRDVPVPDEAARHAKLAIEHMEKAFEPVCDACKEESEHGSAHSKAN